jgi:hypothetical protein
MSEHEQIVASIRDQVRLARQHYESGRKSADPDEREAAVDEFLEAIESISGQIWRRLARKLIGLGLPPESGNLAGDDPRRSKVDEALKECRAEEDELRKALGLL